MANFHCPSHVLCIGDDNQDFPIRNISSELPDLPEFEAVGFCCNGQVVWAFSLASQDVANDNLQTLLDLGCPSCTDPTTYCANATCQDGTVIATYCSTASQAEANAAAAQAVTQLCGDPPGQFSAVCADGRVMHSNISQAYAEMLCRTSSGIQLQPNQQQPVTLTCPDGSFTYVLPAAIFYDVTQNAANARAAALALERANLYRSCMDGVPSSVNQNDTLSHVFEWTGAIEPVTWIVSSGTLPDGIILTTQDVDGLLHGALSGTFTTAGTFTFTIRAIGPRMIMQRDFTVVVAAPPVTPDLYWTMDETVAPRVDKVHGVNLISSGAPTFGAGLYVNAVQLSGGSSVGSGGGTPQLGSGVNGFSIAGWVNAGTGSPPFVGSDILWYFGAVGPNIHIQFGHFPTNAVYVDGNDDTSSFWSDATGIPVTSGSWMFFHFYYDAPSGEVRLRINNSPAIVVGSGQVYGAHVQGTLVFFGAGDYPNTRYDEIAIMSSRRFTDAEADFLYNSGIGRTWPL